MFTGIVECTGKVLQAQADGGNITFTVEAPFASELKVDQSISHNGVCLTVVGISQSGNTYQVTAIPETLQKSNLADALRGSLFNLERGLIAGARLDGHLVQGHVDCCGTVRDFQHQEGSSLLIITFPEKFGNLVVDKGSICVNGVSLTIVKAGSDFFSCAIIPYTLKHTNLRHLQQGDRVNLEFDIIGKYVQRGLVYPGNRQ